MSGDNKGILILTVKPGSYIQIGEDVFISLSKSESKRTSVRIAFKCPKHINIKRIPGDM